jgi:hypothetical protein
MQASCIISYMVCTKLPQFDKITNVLIDLWSVHHHPLAITVAHQLDLHVSMKVTVFWDVVPYGSIEIDIVFQRCLCHVDGCIKYIWNVHQFLWDHMAQHPNRQLSSYSPPWEPEKPLHVSRLHTDAMRKQNTQKCTCLFVLWHVVLIGLCHFVRIRTQI